MKEFLVYVEYQCPKGFQGAGWRVYFPLDESPPLVGTVWGRNPPRSYPCQLFESDAFNILCERRTLNPCECRSIARVMKVEELRANELFERLGCGLGGQYISAKGKKLVTLKTDVSCLTSPSGLICFSDGCQINSASYSWIEISGNEVIPKKGEIIRSEECYYSCRNPSLCEKCPSPGTINWHGDNIELSTLLRLYEVGLKSFKLKFDWGLAAFESGGGR